MSSPAASAALAEAAGALRECAGHMLDCADDALASYGDTPLDQPVELFAQTWIKGLLGAATAIGHLARYTSQLEGE